MKKILLFFIGIMLISCLFGVKAVSAEGVNLSTAKAAYLKDYKSGEVIYAKNENARLPIASMCKIMTLLLIFENIDAQNLALDEEITVSQNASGMGGSQAFLETNGKYKVKDLVKSIIISSANDSCVALAERLYGYEECFVDEMNAKCSALGMENTLFANCTGLPKPTQYSCAKDVATMFGELIKHELYFSFSKIWMDTISHPEGRTTELTNTNKLVRFYEGCDGGKTGYTSETGHCLAATAKRGAMRLISVEISATDSKTRFKEVSDMFNYGFGNFCSKTVLDSTVPMELSCEVLKGKTDAVNILPEKDCVIFSKRNDKDDIKIEFVPYKKVKAPIRRGDAVGTLNVYRNGELFDAVKATAAFDVDKNNYFDYIRIIAKEWNL